MAIILRPNRKRRTAATGSRPFGAEQGSLLRERLWRRCGIGLSESAAESIEPSGLKAQCRAQIRTLPVICLNAHVVSNFK